MGDRFGSRSVFLGGFAAVHAGFAGLRRGARCAAAQRGARRARHRRGLLVPSSLSILNAVYAEDRAMLAKAIAWWTAAGGVSIAAGPVLGGLLMSAFGWRSIFWVNIPICVLGFWLTLRVVPVLRHSGPARSFDVPGQILAVIALTAFIGAVIEVHALGLTHPAVWRRWWWRWRRARGSSASNGAAPGRCCRCNCSSWRALRRRCCSACSSTLPTTA
jgi:DHA2 family methylenomycin A resistance protein-like MFS transporter